MVSIIDFSLEKIFKIFHIDSIMNINFKEWINQEIIKENATGTSCVAVFARPVLSVVRRQWADPFFKKKKKKLPK